MKDASTNPMDGTDHARPVRRVRAARIPKLQACGCGKPVAFDVDKHQFFCAGCGASKQCVCLTSPFTSIVRPVNVA